MYKTLFRPFFFKMKPEDAHHLTINMLAVSWSRPVGHPHDEAVFCRSKPGPEVKAFGLTFPNSVGLAAGYDKEATAMRPLAALGFGHIEIGTVTPLPQEGNPQPRLFRIPEEEAVINHMGFPNQGAAMLAKRIPDKHSGYVLGINLGKNKATPNEKAYVDYLSLMDTFGPKADYLAIDISSPNTPNLRELQSHNALQELLEAIAKKRKEMLPSLNRPLPILIKLAPDLTWAEFDDALQVIQDTGMDGVIATNTTTSRESLKSPVGKEQGGLSGLPLKARSTEVIRYITRPPMENCPSSVWAAL